MPKKQTIELSEVHPITEGTETQANRRVRDSVFQDLFQNPRYLLQLYQAIHPEDTDTTESDLTDITIKCVLMEHIYNDLGFMVNGRLLLLVESQSTWSLNIVVRMFLYLADTWHSHIRATKQNAYSSKKLSVPIPELYVIYVGDDRGDRPEWISLSEEFLNGRELPAEDRTVELKARILYKGREDGDIIDQYVLFSKIYAEQRRLYGNAEDAIRETLRICKDRNILKEYLEAREEEVVRIMTTLFNDEELQEVYGRERWEEGLAEGRAEGKAEGKAEGFIETLYNLVKKDLLSPSAAAGEANQSEHEFRIGMERFFSAAK